MVQRAQKYEEDSRLGLLPRYEDYETNILGCIFENPQLITQVSQTLNIDAFYSTRHQVFYSVMLKLHDEGASIDELTVLGALRNHENLEEWGGFAYLGGLRNLAIPSAFDYHLKKVIEAAEQRRLWETCQRLSQAITSGLGQPEIDRLTEEISKVSPIDIKKKLEIPWPKALAKPAFHGLAGEVVRAIEPHSEADEAALLGEFLTAFGSVVGPRPYFRVEADQHRMRLNITLVGESSKARKGTSWGHIRTLFKTIDQEWAGNIQSGLSSGEGLIWAVRNEITKREPIRENKQFIGYQDIIADPGISDKRLLVVEPEFASTLRVLGREGNTLSAVIRNAWDTGDLQTLTKNSQAKATGAHISLIMHITRDELLRYLTNTEAANGFGNRFLWFCVKRSKSLPFGGDINKVNFEAVIKRLAAAVQYASKVSQIQWATETRPLWAEVYPALAEGKPGLINSMTARAEAYVTRLACIYALIDQSDSVRPEHLKAALAVWDYADASVKYIFQDMSGDPLANEILEALLNKPAGMTRTEIYKYFNHHKTSEQIEASLKVLDSLGKVRMEAISTDGRPKELWFLSEP